MSEKEFDAIATAGQEYGRALERLQQAQPALNKLTELAHSGAYVIGTYDAERLLVTRRGVMVSAKAELDRLRWESVDQPLL